MSGFKMKWFKVNPAGDDCRIFGASLYALRAVRNNTRIYSDELEAISLHMQLQLHVQIIRIYSEISVLFVVEQLFHVALVWAAQNKPRIPPPFSCEGVFRENLSGKSSPKCMQQRSQRIFYRMAKTDLGLRKCWPPRTSENPKKVKVTQK